MPVQKDTYQEGTLKNKKVCADCFNARHTGKSVRQKADEEEEDEPTKNWRGWGEKNDKSLLDLNVFLDESAEEKPEEKPGSRRDLKRPSLHSVRSVSAQGRGNPRQEDVGRQRGRSLPARKSQTTIATPAQLAELQGSFASSQSPGAAPRDRSPIGGRMGGVLRSKSQKSVWLPEDGTVEAVPDKEKYRAGDHQAGGDWPEHQGERPEDGDMSDFDGPKWEDFMEQCPDVAQLIFGMAEALGSKRKWENESEKLLKEMRPKSRGAPKEALRDAPGRKQVILFMSRIAARRPIYRRQAAELQELFFQ